MKQLAAAFVLALVLAGSAGADVFRVVPNTSTAAVALPSAQIPNAPGTVSFSLAPPASPETLAYPQLLGLWQRAGAAYGIPWQVLAAINKIESNFGRNMGPSSAGAIGWMQFIPSTWLRWGVDANGDGVADPWNPTDAVFSAARYLAAAGGTSDLYRGVYAYNHADWYVREVLSLADLYGGDNTVVFSLDRMQQNLDAARRDAARTGELVIAAEKVARRESRAAAHWQARASKAALLSDRLAFEQRAGHAAGRRDAANARVAKLLDELTVLQQDLERAQQASASASFDSAASQLLSAPSYSGGYVFPVGGGPGVVFA